MSNSLVIDSESESVCCYILKMCSFMLKIRYFFFFSMLIFNDSYKIDCIVLFSDNCGVYLFVFQAGKMLLNVWFIIGSCVFNRI